MIRDREYQRKETTTPVKNTTFAIALISSANPLTEKIRPNPLIKFNFSANYIAELMDFFAGKLNE